jgi:Na+/H+ antiporter NhaD/arsenite permease-like protein
VVIAQVAKRNNQPFTFLDFCKLGIPFTLLSLVLCSGYIYLRYFYR